MPPALTTPVGQQVRYALVSADGRRITVTAIGGGCTNDAHLSATETASTVSLHLVGYEVSNVGCGTNLIFLARWTTLTAPLGGRALVDGSTGRIAPYFDGRRLAEVRWLPHGAGPAADHADGRGWARIYAFAKKSEGPIEVDQIYGDTLRSQFQPNPAVRMRSVTVHGRRAELTTQRDEQGRLLVSRLGWYEDGFTFIVQSVPQRVQQRPSGANVLEHVVAEMRLPAA